MSNTTIWETLSKAIPQERVGRFYSTLAHFFQRQKLIPYAAKTEGRFLSRFRKIARATFCVTSSVFEKSDFTTSAKESTPYYSLQNLSLALVVCKKIAKSQRVLRKDFVTSNKESTP